MPRRTISEPVRVAAKSVASRKTKKSMSSKFKLSRRDLRFSLSLVILIGMLTFSSLLLLTSLNRTLAINKETKSFNDPWSKNKINRSVNSQNQILNDGALGYTVAVPNQLGKWYYKIGIVQSLTDDSLSNQYLRIYIPFSGKNSNNMDQQYKDILTIRKFTAKEWSDVQKDCQKDEQKICDIAGTEIKNVSNSESNSDDSVYAYTKAEDCPGNLVVRCSLANEILKSFSLK